MRRRNGPWVINDSEQKFRNEFIEVNEDRVIQPDGKPGTYATVKMKQGLCVLPLDADGSVHLTRQFRYAIGRESIEPVAGGVDEGESAEEAARRELKEETGIEAEELIDLGRVDLDTSIVCCPVRLFLARGLSFTKAEQEGTEDIERITMTLDEAVEKVMKSEITGGAASALILKARLWLDRTSG